jgi:hypothetical protein
MKAYNMIMGLAVSLAFSAICYGTRQVTSYTERDFGTGSGQVRVRQAGVSSAAGAGMDTIAEIVPTRFRERK